MIKFIQKLVLAVVIIYVAFLLISPQMANFVLAVCLVLSVPVLIVRQIFMDKLYRHSISIVSKQFIIGENALSNEHCTVKYTPDEKIIVLDNFVTKNHGKRMFTLKNGQVRINRAWNRLCRVYDSFVTLDSLASFFSYDTKVDIITLEAKIKENEKKSKQIQIDASNQGPKFVEMSAIQPDPYSKGLETPNDAGAKFVELDNLTKREQFVKPEEKAPEFADFQDILTSGSNKIDVNSVTATEIAILPGINIVKAKKIIEYRDKNGMFKSVDDFLKVAEVKDCFVDKIKKAVVIRSPEDNNGEEISEGRIIDL